MDGKVKRCLRSRSQRNRVRRRDGFGKTSKSPSSGSDSDQSFIREHGTLRDLGGNTPSKLLSSRPRRLSRSKRRVPVSKEEDIIDGFAIASFLSLDYLELALRGQAEGFRLETWERKLAKRRRMEKALISLKDFTIQAGNTRTEAKAEKCRRNSASKRQVKALGLVRSNSIDGHSDMESSFSGLGYSCDSESDIHEKMMVTAPDRTLTLELTTGMNGKDGMSLCDTDRVSGLQRSQEENSDVLLTFPAPSLPPSPAHSSAPSSTPSSTPESSLSSTAPTSVTQSQTQTTASPSPFCVKKERTSPIPACSPVLANLAAVKKEPQGPSLVPQNRATATGLLGSPCGHASLSGRLNQPRPAASGACRSSSPSPWLPVSYHFLPGQGPGHPRPTVFPGTLPPPPATAMAGHPVGTGYSEQELLQLELNRHFLVQSSGRSAGSAPPPLWAEPNQRSYRHQRTHQGSFRPCSTSSGPPGCRPSPSPPVIGHPNIPGPFRARSKTMGRWSSMHGQIAWQIFLHQQRLKFCGDAQKQTSSLKMDFYSRPTGLCVPPGLPYLPDPTQTALPPGHVYTSPFTSSYHHPLYWPSNHYADRPNLFSCHGNLRNVPSNPFVDLRSLAAPGSLVSHRQDKGPPNWGQYVHHEPWSRLHQTLTSCPVGPSHRTSAGGAERDPPHTQTERVPQEVQRNPITCREDSQTDWRSQTRDHRSSFSSSFQISNLIGHCSPERNRRSVDRKWLYDQGLQCESKEFSLSALQMKPDSSPSPQTQSKRAAESLTFLNHSSSSSPKTPVRIKQERDREPEKLASALPSTQFPPHPPSHAPQPPVGLGMFPPTCRPQDSSWPYSIPPRKAPSPPVSHHGGPERTQPQPQHQAFAGAHRPALTHLSSWEAGMERKPYRGFHPLSQQLGTQDPKRNHVQRKYPSQHPVRGVQHQAEQLVKPQHLQGSPHEFLLSPPPSVSPAARMAHPSLSPSPLHRHHSNLTPPISTEKAPPPVDSIATNSHPTDCTISTDTSSPTSSSKATPTGQATPSGDVPPSQVKYEEPEKDGSI